MWYPRILVGIGALAASGLAMAAGGASLNTRLLESGTTEPSVLVDFAISGVTLTPDANNFSSLAIDGMSTINQVGMPDLPSSGVLLAVPAGFDPHVSLLSETTKVFPGVTVAPYQQKWRCSTELGSTFELDDRLYDSAAVYPANTYKIEEVGYMQDLRIVRLALTPAQMDFGKHSLVVTNSMSLRVDFVPNGKAGVKTRLPSSISELARKLTVNGGTMRSIETVESPEKMLIVVADQLKSEIESLVSWKRARGLAVDVVTYSEAGGTKEAVQRYVQNYYNQSNPRPTYLLLVGNGTTLPPFRRSTSSGSAASDYPYALLSGTDIVPDIFVGRIVANDAAEVRVQVTRWMNYERSPEANGTWYSKGTTIASNEGSGPSDVQYAEQIQAEWMKNTYTSADKFYQGQGSATATNIVAALDSGRSWLTYIGHGSGTSWGSTNTSFSTSTIRTLKNYDKLPIIVDVACENGSFVDISMCFGKQWVVHTSGGRNAGAVGYYGASVSTSWHEPAVMAVGVAKRHYDNKISNLGGSLVAGQLYLIEKMGTGANVVDNLEWYNLFGDPSMTMRTATPGAFEMSYNLVDDGDNRRIDVRTTGTRSARANVKVALVGADGFTLLGIGSTGTDGLISFSVPATASLSGAKLTGTGYNFETREVSVQ